MSNRHDTTNNFSRTSVTDTGSMYSMLQYTEKKDLSLVEVAGYTANAFRIIIDRERVNVAGCNEIPVVVARRLTDGKG